MGERCGILGVVENQVRKSAQRGTRELWRPAPWLTWDEAPMTLPTSSRGWGVLCGAVALGLIALATLMPTDWVPRPGLHWLIEHFVGYFALTIIACVAWPRPVPVAGILMVLAGVLEALQGATVDRTPDMLSAVSGAAGVLAAAVLVGAIARFRNLGAHGGS